ncbi:unnamed protein product [Protopolystoma xenopodis]|uniref:Uncharacterized protein n=1 Tax=Protopolystoma xenopodis TaxID=117903 RepID=A0A3S5CE70_9PLAT|nr:unnamed protein product [Protopolystoma xenopodis]
MYLSFGTRKLTPFVPTTFAVSCQSCKNDDANNTGTVSNRYSSRLSSLVNWRLGTSFRLLTLTRPTSYYTSWSNQHEVSQLNYTQSKVDADLDSSLFKDTVHQKQSLSSTSVIVGAKTLPSPLLSSDSQMVTNSSLVVTSQLIGETSLPVNPSDIACFGGKKKLHTIHSTSQQVTSDAYHIDSTNIQNCNVSENSIRHFTSSTAAPNFVSVSHSVNINSVASSAMQASPSLSSTAYLPGSEVSTCTSVPTLLSSILTQPATVRRQLWSRNKEVGGAMRKW